MLTTTTTAAGRARAGLKLRAEDEDDVAIVAACLQDALVPLREMAFLKEEERFAAVFMRFMWEAPDADRRLQLVRSALVVDRVEAVKLRGIDRTRTEQLHELLTLTAERLPEGGGARVCLVFAGEGTLQIRARSLLLTLEDFGEPWPSHYVPRHLDEARSGL
jgi:Protein of unknown function (DUF2948)